MTFKTISTYLLTIEEAEGYTKEAENIFSSQEANLDDCISIFYAHKLIETLMLILMLGTCFLSIIGICHQCFISYKKQKDRNNYWIKNEF